MPAPEQVAAGWKAPRLSTPSRLAVTALGLLVACGSNTTAVSVGDVEIELGFFVQLRDREVIHIGGAFGLNGGPYGESRVAGVAEDDDVLILVVIDEAPMRAHLRSYDHSRRNEARLLEASYPEIPDSIFDDPVEIALPPDVRIFRVPASGGEIEPADFADFPALEGLGLELPTNLDFCGLPKSSVDAFGARSDLLPAASGPFDLSDRVNAIEELSDDRLLVVADSVIFTLDAGGELLDATTSDPSPSIPARRIHPLAHADVATLAREAGQTRAFVGGGLWEPEVDPPVVVGGFIAELEVAELGLSLVRTTTVAADGTPLPAILSIAYDDEGRLLAGGPEAHLFVDQGSGPVLVPLPDPGLGQPQWSDVVEIELTGDPASPHILGLRGEYLMRGDAVTGPLTGRALRPANQSITTAEIESVRSTMQGREVWVAGRSRVLHVSRESQAFTALHLPLLAGLDGCLFGADPNAVNISWLDVVSEETHVFTLSTRCAAVISIDPKEDCAAVLPFPGTPVSLGLPDNNYGEVFAIGASKLYVGGRHGRVYQIER